MTTEAGTLFPGVVEPVREQAGPPKWIPYPRFREVLLERNQFRTRCYELEDLCMIQAKALELARQRKAIEEAE